MSTSSPPKTPTEGSQPFYPAIEDAQLSTASGDYTPPSSVSGEAAQLSTTSGDDAQRSTASGGHAKPSAAPQAGSQKPVGELVTLVLDHTDPNSAKHIKLHIPLSIIKQNSVSHFKYLFFCASIITGIKTGHLSLTQGGDAPPDPVDLMAGQTWWWMVPEGDEPIGSAAIHLSAGSTRPSRNQVNGHKRGAHFRKHIKARDTCCVFTGWPEGLSAAMHIIPHHVNDAFFRDIFQRRGFFDQDAEVDPSTLTVDHMRNGLFVKLDLYALFDSGNVGIIATPNEILQDGDLHPEVNNDEGRRNHMKYPETTRFTLHWFEEANKFTDNVAPNNSVARFKRWRRKVGPQDDRVYENLSPHPDLINYSYACRLVRKFGEVPATLKAFRQRDHMPRRPALTHGSSADFRDPYNDRGDRSDVPTKLDDARNKPPSAQSSQNPAPGQQPGGFTSHTIFPTSSVDEDDVNAVQEQHPIGTGKVSEDGRMSAEDVVYYLHMRRAPVSKNPPNNRMRIGQWREDVPLSGVKEEPVVWDPPSAS